MSHLRRSRCVRRLVFPCVAACLALALIARGGDARDVSETADAPAGNRAGLEAAFAKLLSGATLEGSYTTTDGGEAPRELRRDRYTLGEVKKLEGNLWLFQSRIEYKGSKVMIPLPLPVEWAGDTPVITLNDVAIPGFGTFTARVMFYDNHYVGYWKHSGESSHGGHLFGIIHPAGDAKP